VRNNTIAIGDLVTCLSHEEIPQGVVLVGYIQEGHQYRVRGIRHEGSQTGLYLQGVVCATNYFTGLEMAPLSCRFRLIPGG
jgi:hypothetical protein